MISARVIELMQYLFLRSDPSTKPCLSSRLLERGLGRTVLTRLSVADADDVKSFCGPDAGYESFGEEV